MLKESTSLFMHASTSPSLPFRFFALLLIIAVAGCDWFGEDHVERSPCSLDGYPSFSQFQDFMDFGCEKGFYIYTADKTKIQWTRNRNFVSIEFIEEISQENLMRILNEYDLLYHSNAYSVKHVLARVVNKPAENYYTTYGDSTLNHLGNRPEVKYALPVFLNKYGQALMLADRILITFKDEVSEERELAILDSLMAIDHLLRMPFIEPPYLLRTSKASRLDPLSLVNHYTETIASIEAADPVFAFILD